MMQNLTQHDTQTIVRFLTRLCTCHEVTTFGSQIVSQLPQVVPSELTLFSTINYQNREVKSTASSSVSLDSFRTVIFQHFNEHPHIAYAMKTGDHQTYKISDFINQDQLHTLEGVYQQYLRPLCLADQMTVLLPPDHISSTSPNIAGTRQDMIGIGLHRDRWNFSERDRAVLDVLRPHLHQAYQNAIVFTQMQQTIGQLNQAVEQSITVILSIEGEVRLMPQSAWQLLHQYFQPTWIGSHLLPETLQQWVNYQISLLTDSEEISPPCLPLRVEQNGKCLIIRLIANLIDEQYLLILEEQALQSFSVASLRLLGLTEREAEVLLWVAEDKSNPEIATILGCSPGTVKKHLDHIYEKFGVQSRLAAVIYAMRQLGILNH